MPGLGYLLRLAVARNRPLAAALALAFLVTLIAVPTYVLQLQARGRTEARLAYLGNLSGAAAALRAGDAVGAKRRLEACGEELRGWEWHHLAARLDQSLATPGRFPTAIKHIELEAEGILVTRAGQVERSRGESWGAALEPPPDVRRWPLLRAWHGPAGWRALDAAGALWTGQDQGTGPARLDP